MELPNIGQQCAQSGCNQLDFLPLQCKCGKLFCLDHFNSHSETCAAEGASASVEPRKIENTFKCSHSGCNQTSLVPLFCNKCRKHFCIQHRHLTILTTCSDKDEETVAAEKERYAAPVRQFNKAKAAVDLQIEQSLEVAKKKGNNLANKVQLMKIKSKAKGMKTIPISDRLYFNIFHSQKNEACPIFVSKTWSVGRAIDAIASEINIQNDNNKSTGKKLRLFKKDTPEIITRNVSDILQSLIDSGVIIDGENLVIDYVNDC